MEPRQITPSTEFDSCWNDKKPLHENLIALFSAYKPYSWNLLSRKHHVGTATGIIKHINEGYPAGKKDEKVNLKDNPDLLFLYLCMTDELLKAPNKNGELKRRLNYAFYKINKLLIPDAARAFFSRVGTPIPDCSAIGENSDDETKQEEETDQLLTQSVYFKRP